MSEKSRVAALRIAQLREEYSPKELADAVSLLKRFGGTSDLLEYLSGNKADVRPGTAGSIRDASRVSKPLDQITSRAVKDIADSDPKKHEILKEFDRLLRQGRVFETNSEIRRFGEAVSKEFRSGPTRKDNISALMTVLTSLSLGDLSEVVNDALRKSSSEKADDYQRLAQYLMRGK